MWKNISFTMLIVLLHTPSRPFSTFSKRPVNRNAFCRKCAISLSAWYMRQKHYFFILIQITTGRTFVMLVSFLMKMMMMMFICRKSMSIVHGRRRGSSVIHRPDFERKLAILMIFRLIFHLFIDNQFCSPVHSAGGGMLLLFLVLPRIRRGNHGNAVIPGGWSLCPGMRGMLWCDRRITRCVPSSLSVEATPLPGIARSSHGLLMLLRGHLGWAPWVLRRLRRGGVLHGLMVATTLHVVCLLHLSLVFDHPPFILLLLALLLEHEKMLLPLLSQAILLKRIVLMWILDK